MSPRFSDKNRKQIRTEARQQLLNAATQEFAKNGFDGANINTISLAAGFAKGTIYNYFRSKKELMFTLLEESGFKHFDFISESIRKAAHPVRRLELFFVAGFRFVEEDSARGQLLISTLYGTHPEFKERLYQVYQPMFQLVAEEIISPGIEQGSFRQVDPTNTSAMIMSFYLGTASNVDQNGKPWIDPGEVSIFVLNALRTDQ